MNRVDRIRLQVFISLACDADYQRLSNGLSVYGGTVTIAEALEVMK